MDSPKGLLVRILHWGFLMKRVPIYGESPGDLERAWETLREPGRAHASFRKFGKAEANLEKPEGMDSCKSSLVRILSIEGSLVEIHD